MRRTFYILCFLFLLFLVGCTKSYVLTYETNGADPIESVEVKAKEVVTLTNPANRVGFTFGGWYLESDFKTKVTEVTVTKDVSVYAKWDVITFTVKFKDQDGTQIGKDVIVDYGKGATAPADPTRVGYTFSGWDKSFANVTSDLTITATYNIKKYDVKFYDHDDTQIGTTQSIEHGKKATAPVNPVREGFVFDKWDKAFDNVTGNLEVKAVYKVATFTVEFQDHAGKRIGEVLTVEYGKDATAPTAPTRTGYEFEKWDKVYTNVKASLVIKAVYKAIQYNIKYYDGDSLLDHTPLKYTIEAEVNLGAFNKDGFVFVNWYLDSDLKTVVTKIDKETTGDIVLYGKWLDESKKFSTSYELNGGLWTWTVGSVTTPGNGIDAVSNLPEIFMLDYYTYLKDNNLLTSSKVNAKLHKTNWDDFKKSYIDPVAIYNHTSTVTYSTPDGYSQFFYESATGDANTGKITSITGGFFGTEPYKTKYATLVQHLAYLVKYKSYSSPADQLWGGEQAKAAAGFILDGYFYGTQGAGDGLFKAFRSVIPNTNVAYVVDNTTTKKVDHSYLVTEYVQGLIYELKYVPSKEGHVFAGWFDNEGLTGAAIVKIEAGVTPAIKYYAKWLPVA